MRRNFVLLTIFFIGCSGKYDNNVNKESCGYESCHATDPSALNVHIIAHSHDDVGWNKNVDAYFYDDAESVISSVITALMQNSDRRFIQVETAFFKMWWEKQNDYRKQNVIDLINSGRLEVINGAWSMNDEATVNYQSVIDHFTLGIRYMEDRLGKCARPRIGWQIDPFGHTREQASIFAQLGFDAVFFARIDHRDKDNRYKTKTMEVIWQGSQNLDDSDIFTSVLYEHYHAPNGFDWNHGSNNDPIIEDEDSPDYNYKKRVEDFTKFVNKMADKYISNNILVTFGGDFHYRAALEYFLNLDKLIEGFKKFPQVDINNRTINLIYSTPSCYTKAVNEYIMANNIKLQRKMDDFLPHSDTNHKYWTGFYSSRPTSKRNERQSNNLLQIGKQLSAVSKIPVQHDSLTYLGEALGVMQHHDAITGTEKQHVKDSYQRVLSAGNNKVQVLLSETITKLLGARGDALLDLHTCYLANVSRCTQSGKKDEFSVVLYNPLARNVSYFVNIPVPEESYIVLDPQNKIVETNTMQQIKDFGTNEKNILFFNTELPPLGISVYNVIKNTKENAVIEKVPVTDEDPIGYFDTNIKIDSKTGLLKSITMHGTTLDVKQDLLFYKSAHDNDGTSGAYLFRPDGEAERLTTDKVVTTVSKGSIVTEVKQIFNDWGTQIIRIYKDEPDFIEIDWLVGPIDVSDGIGKEVILRYTTNLKSNGLFYTDSNGREIIERTRNKRSDYTYTNEEPIAGNYYPVTSSISIQDSNLNIEFIVLNDRAQGGTSLKDGELELMVHRRCVHDDGKGVGEHLDEKDGNGQGILVRGQHYLTLGQKTLKDNTLASIRRKIALRKLNAPWQFISDQNVSDIITQKQISLSSSLPENIHILTMELLSIDDEGTKGKLLLRFEHIMEKTDDPNLSKDVTLDIENVFEKFTITSLTETVLSGNIKKEDNNRLIWDKTKTTKTYNGSEVHAQFITLSPMQIRTFIAEITFNG